LLHGVGGNAFAWQWVLPTPARTYRVYAPDLPGSGGSAKNPSLATRRPSLRALSLSFWTL
jgi:pimeloyl-ACP methyl ester carboxylesterase